MIVFENLNKRHVVVTACKVASTSLQEFFTDTDYMGISQKRNQGVTSKKELMKDLLSKEFCNKFDKFTFVVRDPQNRYISGVGEVLKIVWLISDSVIDKLNWVPRSFNKNNFKVHHISKTFEQQIFTKIILNNLMRQNSNDYSFGLDPHVSNWMVNILVPILAGKEVEIVVVNDLNNWAESNFNRIPTDRNKTSNALKGTVEKCVRTLRCFDKIDYYLFSEKNIFNWVTSEDFKSLSNTEKIKQAKDLLRENISNKNGFVTYINDTMVINNTLIENLEKNL